jgi:hypothetical protein
MESNQPVSNQITIHPAVISRVLFVISFVLIIIDIAVFAFAYISGKNYSTSIVKVFSFDTEKNIPTCYATLLLLFTSLILVVITLLKRKQNDSMFLYWALLSFGFLYIAVDEFFSLHEKVIKPLRKLLNYENFGFFYFAWVIPGIALVVLLGLVYLKFLFRLPKKTMVNFIVAGVVYVGGALGVELIGGRYREMQGINFTYKMIATVEESLEMLGVVMFIRALLLYLSESYKEVQLRFKEH